MKGETPLDRKGRHVVHRPLRPTELRLYFKQVKTSLTLPKDQVDRLREAAGRLLREAPAFQRLVEDLNQSH